jgi:hypothetical protein
MGPQISQLVATLCVTSSLTLVALGGSELTRRFGRPHANHGTRFRYGCHILQCRGRVILRLFTTPMEPSHFASSVITPQGYKAGGHSYATYLFPHDLPLSPCFLPYG